MVDEANDRAEGVGEQQPGGAEPAGEAWRPTVIDLQAAREEAKKKQRDWDDVDRLVERFNRRYCVTNDGGVTVVFEERSDPVRPGRYMLFKYTFADFQKRYNNRLFTITIQEVN
jgi:hypothetical protein